MQVITVEGAREDIVKICAEVKLELPGHPHDHGESQGRQIRPAREKEPLLIRVSSAVTPSEQKTTASHTIPAKNGKYLERLGTLIKPFSSVSRRYT